MNDKTYCHRCRRQNAGRGAVCVADWLHLASGGQGIDHAYTDLKMRECEQAELKLLRKVEAEADRLQESDDALGMIHAICADAGLAEGHAVERVRALASDLAALRAAVLAWDIHYHRQGCTWGACNCGADAANAARAAARKLAGGETE